MALRAATGGEAVFFQGAAGNVNPMCAFCSDEAEARRMGERLALEAMHSLADRPAWPQRLVSRADASLVPMINFRFEDAPGEAPTLSAAEERLTFPLLPVPSLPEARELAAEYAAAAREAEARGAGPAERLGIAYHAKWARGLVEDLETGDAASSAEGPVNAVRIGDGVIVSGPGEVFTEIGLAVRERSPGQPTLYSGYTNGAVSYFATSEAFSEGGYEPAFSNRTYGLPAPLAPGCDRLLVERGVRLAESLFPECVPFSGTDWNATAEHFALPSERLVRPEDAGGPLPGTAPPPG
jgi:neutral ceramidase